MSAARVGGRRASVTLEGVALHAGVPTRVTLRRDASLDEIEWRQGAARARQSDLRVTRADRGVRVEAGEAGAKLSIDLVEHLSAALAGLGVREGLVVDVDGPEVPLLDGGARAFAAALADLLDPIRPHPPRLRVARAARIAIGASVYRFAVADRVGLVVRTAFPPPVGRGRCRFDGDARDFAARIAPARTFGWLAEVEALRREGRAQGADLGSVCVFTEAGSVPAARPAEPDEPVRHKMLDLVGDLGLHGGPPVGLVACSRPGHSATHAAVARALEDGVLVRA